ncbi:MAG: hypothetical protein Q7K03_11310 [Dehalococcoidia bacterium]|nr:hypothetical protein [Dehalococcoidia bacterium]
MLRADRNSPRQRSGGPGVAAGDLLALPTQTRETCRLEPWDSRRGQPGWESLAVACWAARRMALGYRTVGHMLTLAGETGVGKTHLALAIAWEWVERFEREPWSILTNDELLKVLESGIRRHEGWEGWRVISDERNWRRPGWPKDHGVRFARVGELLDMLQKGYEDGLYYELLDECQNCRLLVLDDLGHQRETPWRLEIVDRIVDARYISGRWTVVTTNLPGDQLPPRIASRLRDRSTGFVAAIEAGDYRPLKSSNGRRPW